ncbi:hypothetical protein BU689_09670 [Staphylococcus chromogenes]|uniref:hypothetical protein n=2 Tax=Staphylococcus chromogenes TaxID=46126 RepID=UPI000E699650|nr:hypothetical protein [Staphylococcus chromogenes]RIM01176.1 hypothetical protein BU689_09670 [Staphylococcus chromogenes]
MARKAEDISGKVYGIYEIIGDTGKRSNGGHQIVIARNTITGELYEGLASNFKNKKITGYIGNVTHKNRFRESMSDEKVSAKRTQNIFKDGVHAKKLKDNTFSQSLTGYNGIYFDKRSKSWQVKTNFKKQTHTKYFNNFREAVLYLNQFNINNLNHLIKDEYNKYKKITYNEIIMNDFVVKKQKEIDRKIYFKYKKSKGYTWQKKSKKWIATITIDGKQKNIGYFKNEKDAIEARRQAVEKYFNPKGEF